MPESRNRDIATSLGQAVKNNTITSTGSLAVVGLTAYDSAGLLPSSYDSNNAGTLGFAEDSDRLYIHTGQGWFNIAIINTTPIFETSPSASYDLASDATAYNNGTATTITLAARDSEGFPLTWSYAANSAFNNIAYVSNDSSVYTIIPKSQDSVGEAKPAAGTLTFSTSDGINIASASSTFTLLFDATIANSENTVLLTKGVGDKTDLNRGFDDISDANHTVSTSNTPYMGTFSPYSSGGYSINFEHAGDYLQIPNGTDYAFGTGDFTIEAWLWSDFEGGVATRTPFDFKGSDVNNTHTRWDLFTNGQWYLRLSGTGVVINPSSWRHPNYEWVHYAYVRASGTTKFYANGIEVGSFSDTGTYVSSGTGTNDKVFIGRSSEGYSSGDTNKARWLGFFHDIRIVKGTAVYTGNFTPPQGPLTLTGGNYPSTTNVNINISAGHTVFLLDTSPFLKNLAATANADGDFPIVNGKAQKKPFTAYKLEEYSASNHGGSYFSDGSPSTEGLSITNSTGDAAAAGTPYTLEFWLYPTTEPGSGQRWVTNFGDNAAGRRIYMNSGAAARLFIDNATDGHYYSHLSSGSGHTGYAFRQRQWYHVAITRNSSNASSIYINGVKQSHGGDTSDTNTFGSNSGTTTIANQGNAGFGSANPFIGYISDYRYVNGTEVYTGDFTPPTKPLTKTGGTYPSSTNIATIGSGHTRMLFNFTEGGLIDASGSSNFLGYNQTQSDTGLQKFSGNPVLKFDGAGDAIKIESSGGRPFWFQGDFTIECHAYVVTGNFSLQNSKYRTFFYIGISGQFQFCIDGSGNPLLYDNGSAIVTSSTAVTGNTWHHIAVTRTNNQVVLFLDGVEKARATHSTDMGGYGVDSFIGAYSTTEGCLNGSISDLRITKGLSRYPFIPLKETLTTTTTFQGTAVGNSGGNVKLLCGHTSTYAGGDVNRLTDGSDTGHTIYNNGIAISTFAPASGMSSLYFERASGTSDYFNIDAHADFLLDGDFTIEFWMFASGYAVHNAKNQRILMMDRNSGNVVDNFQILLNDTNGTIYLYAGSALTYGSNTVNVANGKWYHVAVVRNGSSSGNLATFVNGAIDTTTTYTNSINANGRTTLRPSLGIFTGTSGGFQGYISNFRLIKGQALYVQNFTPPAQAITV